MIILLLAFASSFTGCCGGLSGRKRNEWLPFDTSDPELIHKITDSNLQVLRTFGWNPVELSLENPVDEANDILLLEVAESGEVVIEVRGTGEILRASPGSPFLGAYRERTPGNPTRTFGEEGLQVVSSNPATQSVELKRFFVEWRYRRTK
ncbi:MAG: hypothetical protein LAT83_18095 [Kiritimatiellae bacterium]|nr:hypothetical protein [Kiritimatiellia bacterium]